MSSVTQTLTSVKISANFHNPFTLLAAINAGATVRCARCRRRVVYADITTLRSQRRRAAIAICRECANRGAA